MATIDLRSPRFRDQVYGCWMGKNCGGTLGAPLEKAWGEEEPFDIWWYPELREGGIPNDDLEMQLIWLKALEEVGPQLKAADLAQYWLDHIGYNWDEYGLSKTNLRLGLLPPVSGAYNNWFKDCMGCPIRSEIWACIAPGAPRVAARYAYEDAICDHAGGESVYGELFNTAVESAAFVISDREQLIDIGLSYVNPESKTAQTIQAARQAHAEGLDWKMARRRVLAAAPHYNAQYSPINIGFQVLGWLYGEDFGDTLCKTVNCGYDTDCTGATIGSVLGIIATRQGLPQRWTEPLGEGISTNESWGGIRAVSTGLNPVPTTLDELTDRVILMAERVLSAHGLLKDGQCVEVDRHSLYADDAVRELWHAPTMCLVHHALTCDVTLDYGDTPAVAAGSPRAVTTHLANRHSVAIDVRCKLAAPAGWEVEPQLASVTIAPHATAALVWTIAAPAPAHLQNTNTLYLHVQADQRSAQPAVPIVLIGARRFRVAGPYTLPDATDRELYDRSFDPEMPDATVVGGRKGNWQEGNALDNALPVTELLADGGAVYVQTFLWNSKAQRATIGIPGSGPRKLWVNDALAVDCFSRRPLRPNYNGDGEAYAQVDLVEGWNELLVKYVRTPDMPPFGAHLVAATADDLRHGLVDIGWTRFPWDKE
jgi:ADP-ribosylglycohydrolase